jgi:hypothetical protein
MGFGAVGIGAAIIIAACSASDDGKTGEQGGRLEVVGSQWGIIGDGSPAGIQNVSAVWSPFDASDTGGMFVVGTSLTRMPPTGANAEWMSVDGGVHCNTV